MLDDNVAERPGPPTQNGLQGHLHTILRHMLNLMGPIMRLNETVRVCCVVFAQSNCTRIS